ncbi:Cyclic di-GMP phosphodiesterase Gmr [Methyloligella halotolerans]|uniref:Cyclic di-GMP phosphodiesterase Gmr n=2 Tax=Methyloligella halotolerans TaxID=1177755 RepID=A0A1E2RW82_9HYPH|nr:Cyclic di-GMP phosphodiesterase Gmr [Methyloligella halotolerans]
MPESEENRLEALAEYHQIDTPPEEEFDRLVSLAARIFRVPIALISLLERDRQFFKARLGLDVCETDRTVSFCAHAIMGDEILFVPDATKDERFAANPLVTGPPYIRFYAGKPLRAPNGENIGTFCIIDTAPREHFTNEDRKNLTALANLAMDGMEMRRLEAAEVVNATRFANIAATSPDAIICNDEAGRVTFWNDSAERLFGYTANEMLGKTVEALVPDSWRELYEDEVRRLRTGVPMTLADRTIELSVLRKDGTEFPAEVSLSTWQESGRTSVGAIVRDITERRTHEQKMFELAMMDQLTEVPNRSAFMDVLSEVLKAGELATLLMIDLDGFKETNDSLGHSGGDLVLRQVAARVKAVAKGAKVVARLGGDEFVVLMSGNCIGEIRALADEMLQALCDPYVIARKEVELGASIGIALAPRHGEEAEELMSAADLALYRAKSAGRRRYEFFQPTFRVAAVARRIFSRELRRAFQRNEFELYYQPQVATRTKQLTGAEALLRWNHPERGLLPPGAFLEVLSGKPTAADVGEWILRQACLQAVEWRRRSPGFRIGVNLFAAQFRSGRLLTSVQNALAESGLPPEALELELVETVLLLNDDRTLTLLRELRRLGVGLAFDDYGTGYASLSLLKRYPVTRLKIDQSFVHDLTVDEEDAAVVKAVIYLGKSFGLDVIAEGVETEAQRLTLDAAGCQEAQGFLFGRPMPAAEFTAQFLAARAA